MQYRILVVDDDAAVLRALSMSLAAAGYSLETATKGGDAVETLRIERIDAVILDLSLPDRGCWSGYRLTQERWREFESINSL